MKYQFKGFTANLKNEESDTAVLDIDGAIGFDFMKWLDDEEQNTKESIKAKLNATQASKLIVNVNSLGGDVIDGISIHDMLKGFSGEVETRVFGMTASAGTIVPQSASKGKRMMSDNALYLIHRGMVGVMGWLNRNDLETITNDLTAVDGLIANIYAKRSGKDKAEFEALMNESNGRGKWLTAQEAKDMGLIDGIFEPEGEKSINNHFETLKNSGLPFPEQLIDNDKLKGSLTDDQLIELMENSEKIKNYIKSQINEYSETPSGDGFLTKNQRSRTLEILKLKGKQL